MRALTARLPLYAAALWWGSLTTIGFLVVPLLFAHLATPAMAGAMAAKLFTAQTWVSVVCAVLLLLGTGERTGAVGPGQGRWIQMLAVGGLLLALLVEFAVAPRIVARDNLALWHRVGSLLYFLQWGCATVAVWQLGRHPRD